MRHSHSHVKNYYLPSCPLRRIKKYPWGTFLNEHEKKSRKKKSTNKLNMIYEDSHADTTSSGTSVDRRQFPPPHLMKKKIKRP